ncbi:indole-3-glycerol phosphate synthase TrpC [Telmatospirillum siberiense]|uniref:Indole-3-glycerol phosphate synthase n=1 Tax=Telmatospirillum siberiense TaxID=382514 RepID=A0A2N3PZI4_9PROT|nr:indole-3-glycerol phosphate synthase TrpC [Telmatospirillum siberiense]PKU25771.1 indole-3-glycerol phosphate synthase TrpC [Telmatospirillum siberiense]
MSDILATICANKKRHLETAKQRRSIGDLRDLAAAQSAPRGFAAALTRAAATGYGLIAEIKKASPSAGLIRPDFDPPTLAKAYAAGGASCLSVLTDAPYFQGNDDYLVAARQAVDLPALRKDFMIDPWQIAESRALGADCILLIMACLSDAQAGELEHSAHDLGMDVLIEVHDEAEMERALSLRSPLIGVNNRNLKTMTTDIATTERLAKKLPADRVLVCESGLKTPADLARMARAGARRFLIGESLMRLADVTEATRTLLADPVAA